jgi:hypothetical protein
LDVLDPSAPTSLELRSDDRPVRMRREELRENESILDGQGGALGPDRCRCVRGIADEDDPTAVPPRQPDLVDR